MRGSRASQSDTAILPSRARREVAVADHLETGLLHPLRHRLGREAEPPMRVLLAQEFEIVRREIDDQQPALRPQHARRLADRARAVVEEVQHLMDDHDVEGIARQRQVVDVALAHAAMLQARAVEPGARERQHVEREVDAEPALELRAEQLEHAAGAGAEIEQRAERPVGERGADRRLHRLVGDVQRADAVPLGGMRLEIGLRGGGARGAHLGEPLAVARDDRVVARRAAPTSERIASAAAPCSARRKNAQAPSRKRATSPASASSLRWREMRGCDWRRMSVRSETVSSASNSKAEDAQPRLLAGRLEGRVEVVEADLVGTRHWWDISQCGHATAHELHHIKISLYG